MFSQLSQSGCTVLRLSASEHLSLSGKPRGENMSPPTFLKVSYTLSQQLIHWECFCPHWTEVVMTPLVSLHGNIKNNEYRATSQEELFLDAVGGLCLITRTSMYQRRAGTASGVVLFVLWFSILGNFLMTACIYGTCRTWWAKDYVDLLVDTAGCLFWVMCWQYWSLHSFHSSVTWQN